MRPTSPFRTGKTIKKAWKYFVGKKADSLRAVEEVKQNPGKMWIVKKGYLKPLLNYHVKDQPSFNNQTKILKKTYIQNASLEISNIDVLNKYKTITGKKILPFFTNELEGFDINYTFDLKFIKMKIKKFKI